MISKELLSEVLKDILKKHDIGFADVLESALDNNNLLHINYRDRNGFIKGFFINIYELAHKCKEWIVPAMITEHPIGRTVKTSCVYLQNLKKFKYSCSIEDYSGEYMYFEAPTEPEAIFKACQWILENKESKDD
jgi:hypothetical protein